MILRLLSGSVTPASFVEEAVLCLHVHERHAETVAERVHHLRRLVLAQQAVVDEDAGELVADRLVYEQRRDGAVDAARQRAEDPVASDARADPLDLLLDHRGRRPRRRSARDPVEEILQHLLTIWRMDDLWMELDSVQPPPLVLERGDRRRIGGCGDLRARGRRDDRVAVAHPRDLLLGQILPQCAAQTERRFAELARGTIDATAELLRHQLHPVTDAERRHAELEDLRIDLRRALGVHRGGTTGEDQRDRVPPPQLLRARAMRDELRVDTCLAHAARDQLRVLAAEVDHEHRPLLGEQFRPQWNDVSCAGNSARPS